MIEELRRLGHDVLTVMETGRADQAWPDDQVLAYATSERRTLLTLNRKHFMQLHKSAPLHSGIIVCTMDLDFVGQAARIDAALKAETDLSGKLLRVNRPPSP